jgi:hypothetical protein
VYTGYSKKEGVMNANVSHSPIDMFIEPLSGDASRQDFNFVRWVIGATPKITVADPTRQKSEPPHLSNYLSGVW